MKASRAVSKEVGPAPAPGVDITWSRVGGFSPPERGRRVQRIACASRSSSVCTNKLLNAGCEVSAAGGASTTSA
jgi:hypothetical protein